MITFKQFLVEAAKGVADLQANGMFVVFRPSSGDAEQALNEPEDRVLFQLMQGNPRNPTYSKYIGEVECDLPYKDGKPFYDISVYAVHADLPPGGGYGPFFYDLAAEYASMHGMGIVSSTGLKAMMQAKGGEYRRGDTSDLAAKMWKGYGRRMDVKRGYGGPGYNPDDHALTSPIRKGIDKLHQLAHAGLIVDPRGQPIDLTQWGS